jgi:hypothetical protein
MGVQSVKRAYRAVCATSLFRLLSCVEVMESDIYRPVVALTAARCEKNVFFRHSSVHQQSNILPRPQLHHRVLIEQH